MLPFTNKKQQCKHHVSICIDDTSFIEMLSAPCCFHNKPLLYLQGVRSPDALHATHL